MNYSSDNQDLETKWSRIRDSFLREYTHLTPDDLHCDENDFKEVLAQIRDITGISEAKLRLRIKRWDDSYTHFF